MTNAEIEAEIPWAKSVIASTYRRHSHLDQLMSEGMVGLVEAAKRYDPMRGSFHNFAKHRVIGAAQDYLRHLDPALSLDQFPSEVQASECLNIAASGPCRRNRRRPPRPLAAQQVKIVSLMSQGKIRDEIARELGLAMRTINTHIQAMYRRLGVRTAGGAVGEAFRRGILKAS